MWIFDGFNFKSDDHHWLSQLLFHVLEGLECTLGKAVGVYTLPSRAKMGARGVKRRCGNLAGCGPLTWSRVSS